jgi:hypothetical protein
MAWVTVAEGAALGELQPTVEDLELPKGAPLRAVIDLKVPVGPAFDLAGAELVFKSWAPDGTVVTDVHSEGLINAVVEMQADPAWLLAVVAFIKAHWVAILISGLALAALVAFIKLEAPEEFVKGIAKGIQWGAIALIALVVLAALGTAKKALPQRGGT